MAWAALADRVGMSSATSGSGVLTLGSALGAVPPNTCSWQSFATGGIADGQLVSYLILDSNGAWEYGHGTYTASGTTLARTTILGSSNSGSAINCSGTEQVFLTLLQEDLIGRLISKNVYTGSNSTLPIPNYATQAFVRLVGAGGGAKGIYGGCNQGFASAGAGGYLEKWLTGLTPGLNLNLTVGAGGSGSTPSAGGNTSLASGTQSITTLTATGGGAANANATTVNGAGGTPTNGDLNVQGGGGINTSGSAGGSNLFTATVSPVTALTATVAGGTYGGGAVARSNSGTQTATGGAGVAMIDWYA